MNELPYVKILLVLAITWLLIGLAGLIYWLLSFIGNIVFLVLLGVVLAVGLSSLTDRLMKSVPVIPRWLAVIIVYMVLFLVFILVGLIVGIPLVGQIKQLIRQYPLLAVGLQSRLVEAQKIFTRLGVKIPDLSHAASKATDLVKSYGQTIFNGFLSFLLVFSSGISQFILIAVISFYLLIEQRSITESMLGAFPKEYSEDITRLSREIKTIISSFIGGQLLLGLIMGVAASFFAIILGVPYVALIGVFVTVTGLIPIIGSFLGAILPVVVAYSTAPWKALVFIIFFIILSQFISYYLQPKIVGQAIGLNPLTILIALLIGLKLAGFWGAIFAAPIISILIVLIKYAVTWYRSYSRILSE